MPAPNFASFKTEQVHEFWIEGFNSSISGRIEDIEFFEKDSGEVETFLTIVNDTTSYRVKLDSVKAFAEEIPRAA